MMKKIIYFTLILLINNLLGQLRQVGVGQWREHLPYNIAYDLCHTGDKIYVASTLSGFYYDLQDFTQNPLGKISGYSDNDVTEIAYNKKHKAILFGYKSGKVDVEMGNTIYKITDIYRANFEGTKTINHIYTSNDLAYISGDFGVSVLDIKKREIKESYRSLAAGGVNNKVFASTLSPDGDSIFLATSKGVMVAKISPSVNLMDFANWYTYPAGSGIPVTDVANVCYNNGILYANVNFKGVYYFNGATWSLILPLWSSIPNLTSSNNKLTLCHYKEIITFTDPSTYTVLADTNIKDPVEALYDKNDQLWVATTLRGLVKYTNSTAKEIHPFGPSSQNSFNLLYRDGHMLSLAGGYTSDLLFTFYGAEFYSFTEDNLWKTYNNKVMPALSGAFDLVYSSYNTVNGNTYISSYTNGLFVLSSNNTLSLLTNGNSPLPLNIGGGTSCTGTAVDAQGNIWVCNKLLSSSPAITVLKPNHSLLKNISFPISGEANNILFDDLGNTWFVIRDYLGNHGLLVQKKDGSFVNLSSYLPSNKVNCIEKDLKGSIWIGTEKGIAICYDPTTVTQITTPIFDGFPLLYERNIQAIEIDGGNRKWIGTNDGLWLFNDDATEVELFLEDENSPLPSSNIADIEIHDISGEVFISTEAGTVSYKGDATLGAEAHDSIHVFPNPVPSSFSGKVGIQGLTTDAEVKITDMYGTLIFQCKAEGGMVAWNVKDYNGVRAKTGVYLIFSSTPDGTNGLVGKIAVIE